jgi:poly(ADP-ribose) glycohydrolase ARH3
MRLGSTRPLLQLLQFFHFFSISQIREALPNGDQLLQRYLPLSGHSVDHIPPMSDPLRCTPPHPQYNDSVDETLVKTVSGRFRAAVRGSTFTPCRRGGRVPPMSPQQCVLLRCVLYADLFRSKQLAARMPTQSQFIGCLIGLAVGDATGAPYEGSPAWLIYKNGPADAIVETPSNETRRYTDDTEMAIGVAETLIQCGEINEEQLCSAFAKNYEPSRGYGQGARQLIESMISGGDRRKLAETIFPGGSLGNGAAMRVAPVGLLFCDDLDQVARQAELSAMPTHTHPLGIDGARLMALAVALAVRERRFSRESFLKELLGRAQTEEFQWLFSVAVQLKPDDIISGFGNGLEAHRSVGTAILCFANAPNRYSDVISRAITQGNDTDTLAAMGGAISGARLGIEGIPSHLVESLENTQKGRDYIIDLATRLYDAYTRRCGNANS